jgi:hypothetical protein
MPGARASTRCSVETRYRETWEERTDGYRVTYGTNAR